jgi:hypothetical protein
MLILHSIMLNDIGYLDVTFKNHFKLIKLYIRNANIA